MIARYERPISAAALFARRIASVAVALFVATVAAHRFASLSMSSTVVGVGIATVFAAFAVLLAIVGFWHLWKTGAKAGWASLTAMVCGAVILSPTGYVLWLYAVSPPVRDVTSDLRSPPQWLALPPADQEWLPMDVGSLATQRKIQEQAWPALGGRRYQGAMDRVLQAAQIAMRDKGMKVVAETGVDAFERLKKYRPPPKPPASPPLAEAGSGAIPIPLARPSPVLPDPPPSVPDHLSIQAVHRSLIFGLTSDVVIRMRENGDTTTVDMRVASRYGADLGFGARLIATFFDTLDSDLLRISDSRY